MSRVQHDPAVERAMAARAHRYEFVKPTWRGFLVYVGITFVPMVVLSYYFKGIRVCPRILNQRLD